MVDRVYKGDVPKLAKELEQLGEGFSSLDCQTDWAKLRIQPLLKHVRTLEKLLESPEFTQEFSRLRIGVKMFHSDLVYFRVNVSELKKILRSYQTSSKVKSQ